MLLLFFSFITTDVSFFIKNYVVFIMFHDKTVDDLKLVICFMIVDVCILFLK